MPSRKKKGNSFLVVWDMLGLESIFSIDNAITEIENYEKDKVWKTLKGEGSIGRKPNPIPLQMLIMRARYNSQRSYEIYSFNTTMSEREVRKIFADDPQPIVEWIRENGNKIYSDYIKQERKMIV
jgi:hypothetical protein